VRALQFAVTAAKTWRKRGAAGFCHGKRRLRGRTDLQSNLRALARCDGFGVMANDKVEPALQPSSCAIGYLSGASL